MRKKIVKKAYSLKRTAGKTAGIKSGTSAVKSGFTKQYLKSGSSCRVTFRLPGEAAPDAHLVSIAGDFNNWDPSRSPMKKLKNGSYQISLTLPRDREYRFRYLIDNSRWENDWKADKYAPNAFGCDDSIVVV